MLKIKKPVSDQNFKVSSPFGETRMIKGYDKPKVHYGIDIACPVGTDIFAVADGKILQITDFGKNGFGKFMVLQTKFEKDTYYFFYAHLSQFMAKLGAVVEKGTIIAKSGNSGFSTGPHLHFQVCVNGLRSEDYSKICRNPLTLIENNSGA